LGCFRQDFVSKVDISKVSRTGGSFWTSWALDVVLAVGVLSLLVVRDPIGSDSPKWITVQESDWSCLGDLKDGRISEEGVAPYPVYFERVSLKQSRSVRYWILYTEHPSLAASDEVLRTPASQKTPLHTPREPVALLRDDSGDSFPDVAFLFHQDREDPEELKIADLGKRGCEFWNRPVSSLLRGALQKKSWHMGMARGHVWIPFLEKLHIFEPQAISTEQNLSVLDEAEAHRLFELLTHSIASFGVLDRQDDALFEKTQIRAEKLLSWLGIQHQSLRAPASSDSVWVEGLREPLKLQTYGAPFLYVSKDGKHEKAVFDVLLFNDWATESDWSRRVVQPALK
jgi:hypothetical protein